MERRQYHHDQHHHHHYHHYPLLHQTPSILAPISFTGQFSHRKHSSSNDFYTKQFYIMYLHQRTCAENNYFAVALFNRPSAFVQTLYIQQRDVFSRMYSSTSGLTHHKHCKQNTLKKPPQHQHKKLPSNKMKNFCSPHDKNRCNKYRQKTPQK